MNKPWKLIVLLVGIFLAGGATGALVAMRVLHHPSPKGPPPAAETWAALHVKRLVDEIGLQPAQLEEIRPIVDRRMGELFKLRSRFLDDNRALREIMEREVAAKLTPEQQVKYEKMNKEFYERSRRLERGGDRPPPPDRLRDK